jgi:formamidopyrimidine-DNA glycosylase
MRPEDQDAINAEAGRRKTARKVYTREGFDCPTCNASVPRACRTARAEDWHAARYRLAAVGESWPYPEW